MLVITFETLTNSAGGPWFDGGGAQKPEAKCFSFQSQCFRLEESERQRGNTTKNNFHSLFPGQNVTF